MFIFTWFSWWNFDYLKKKWKQWIQSFRGVKFSEGNKAFHWSDFNLVENFINISIRKQIKRFRKYYSIFYTLRIRNQTTNKTNQMRQYLGFWREFEFFFRNKGKISITKIDFKIYQLFIISWKIFWVYFRGSERWLISDT